MTNEQKVQQATKNLEICKNCKYAKLDKNRQIVYQIGIIKQKFFNSSIKCINPKCGCSQTSSLLNGSCPQKFF